MRVKSLSLAAGLLISGLVLMGALLIVGDVPLSGVDYIEAVIHPQSLNGEIVWGIRLPRNLCAWGVGAMLGIAGAVMQGLLRNPLAEPGILGVSSGAGLGASVAIVLGVGLIPFAVEASALLVSLMMSAVLMAFVARFPDRQALILLGVGISSLCGALMALVFNLSPSPVTTTEILGWLMGSVENRSWQDAALCVAGLAVAVGLVPRLRAGLRLLTLGEETAQSMGVNIRHITLIGVITASVLAGLSVAVAGIIGFVGLAAPHFVRALGLRDPYGVIWPSGLAGGVMVLMADGLIRVMPASGDIRLGVLTSLIGAPLFALIAYKSAKSWA
ncbi:iron ABC transporter permease [Asticcacaulis sp. SL142]|uniref:FecCD family ABC transporter permease n=1 Tax=Asticcacaulis sp. SL142 TaxID=2995155 RepID=UPI00226CE27F|nr:iron ABC transporter permease [Asticcacaulis sp. SL142]WAC48774.1 iron ABC transporter permease [Asticcacaulis sp. SL142]